jgi:hypothetical protein
MFDSSLLIAPDGAGGTVVFSPWVPREGDNMALVFEVTAAHNADFTVEVFQRDADDAGDGTAYPAQSYQVTGTGRELQFWLGLKEVVRFKIALTPNNDQEMAWGLFRFIKPAWFETAKTDVSGPG